MVWPGLLEAWLVLTNVKYHGNLYILIPLNQRLALTRLQATGPWYKLMDSGSQWHYPVPPNGIMNPTLIFPLHAACVSQGGIVESSPKIGTLLSESHDV